MISINWKKKAVYVDIPSWEGGMKVILLSGLAISGALFAISLIALATVMR
ncbi:MAG: hypothetical protein M0024_01325 [Nitrospiraceae bacterium]|nr:hypothetical protein [Nitrospiraceae bacterium]